MSEDRVKTFATVMATAPKLVVDVGWSFLKLKRRAKKCSLRMRSQLVEEGIPRELARRLADDYAGEFSVRKLISDLDIPGLGAHMREK